MNVVDWLRALGLERYEAAFRANDVTVALLPKMTGDDLKDLGVASVGHRRQLLDAIGALHAQVMPPEASGHDALAPPSDPGMQPRASEATAERRPLSVMFCDLVGSTALSSRLDPEDLQQIIRIYQARVAAAVQRFNGFIARYVGDGVLIYFGWPQAHETDAERAVRAGLAVAAAVRETPVHGEALQIRIGIATGLVVIGEPIGAGDSRQQTAVGEAPNRAARLQSLAGPDEVVIDLATRRQIGGLFECRELGAVALKGLPAAVPAWLVVSENRALGQFEALRSGTTPLVGRNEELELLLRRWAQAKSGNGRVVLISADPGVGKSRLAESLAARIAAQPYTRLRYFCSPHYQDDAHFPVIAQMERAAGFAHADEPPVRLAKLEALLAAAALPMGDVAVIAGLHGLRSDGVVPPPGLASQRRKDTMFEALLRQVENLARQQPVLMVFDDVHWIDPSSRELLDRLIERVTDWPVLLLVLFRPEFQAPWIGQPHVTMITLARLDRREAAAMVANVAGDTALPAEIVAEIVGRTDGVPLFVEELTKAVLEADGQGEAVLSAMPSQALAVPPTLHASLMARLDRLGPTAREVAQAGAVIGREFSHALLASITDLPESQLREALDRLVSVGLVFARGMAPEGSYLFKHALVQDAAYGSLLRSRRQKLHRQIGLTLEARFPEIVVAQPALLAQHCQEAGLVEQAVAYRLKATQQALRRQAMVEAATQARKGLEILASLPDSRWCQQQELELQSGLGWALAAAKGHAATETVETFARTQALAEALDRPEYLGSLMFARWSMHVTGAEHRLALSLSIQTENIGRIRNEVALQRLGRLMQGISRFWLGELIAARTLLEEHADLAHFPVDRVHARLHAVRLGYLSRTLALLGYPDHARARIGEAVSLCRQTNNVFTLGQMLLFANSLDHAIGSPLTHTEEVLALATAQKFPEYLGWALAQRGVSLLGSGQAQEALALLTQAMAQLRVMGNMIGLPAILILLANSGSWGS